MMGQPTIALNVTNAELFFLNLCHPFLSPPILADKFIGVEMAAWYLDRILFLCVQTNNDELSL